MKGDSLKNLSENDSYIKEHIFCGGSFDKEEGPHPPLPGSPSPLSHLLSLVLPMYDFEISPSSLPSFCLSFLEDGVIVDRRIPSLILQG